MMGIMQVIGAAFAYLPITYLGRKPLLMFGELAMAISWFVCGLSLILEWYITVFVCILLFLFFFHCTWGGVCWLYVAETTVDSANGLDIFVLFSWITFTTMIFEYMIFGPLGPHGTFWCFSAICFIGFFWIWAVLKETRGLTDLEKKTLYASNN